MIKCNAHFSLKVWFERSRPLFYRTENQIYHNHHFLIIWIFIDHHLQHLLIFMVSRCIWNLPRILGHYLVQFWRTGHTQWTKCQWLCWANKHFHFRRILPRPGTYPLVLHSKHLISQIEKCDSSQ